MRFYQIFLVFFAFLLNSVSCYFWINPRISSELKKREENLNLINYFKVKTGLKNSLDKNINSVTNSINHIEILPDR